MSLQVRHIANRLRNDFSGLIDMSDYMHQSEFERDRAFLSRALTALTLQDLAGVDAADAAAGVIDGHDDHGIDGVLVDPTLPQLWIVQAKWSDNGRASLDQAAALKLHRGIGKLLDGEYYDFNSRFQTLIEGVDNAINTAGIQIKIVVALLGSAQISPQVKDDLHRTVQELNDPIPLAELVIRGIEHFYRIVVSGVAEAKVDLEARLESWGHHSEPYLAYYGTMPVIVADWYATHGERLFAQNIRRSLGLTEVNRKIRTTLNEQSGHFWYFNNGITVLADTVDKRPGRSTRTAGDFHLTGASIVNGAQTVKSVHDAVRQDPESAESGRVWVRLISLKDCPPDFAQLVTEATNTQNQVEARDFVSLDKNQARIRDDFMLSLQRSYVVKRGEPDPEPDAGCSVVEAARALACAHPDPSYAARAKQDSSVLWETGTRGTYEILFGHPPSAYRIWRIVQLVRGVRERLQVEKDDRDGRAAQVAAQGDLLIAHLLFRQTRLEPLDDAQYDWESQLDGALSQVGTILDWLTHRVDAAYAGAFIPPTFRDPQRCTALAELVLGDLSSGRPVPELPSEYSATSASTRGRRTNAVIVLVDSGRIDDGTRLEFRPGTGTERGAIQPWLAVDPRRGEATWVNNRGAPLLWAADGRRYSPSGLAKHMLRQVGLNAKAVQGPSRWFVHGEGSLVELADQVREGDRS